MTKYRLTKDVSRMMTNKELDDVLQNDYEQYIKDIGYGLVRTVTMIEYKAGETEALVWNDGEKEKTKIKLPLEDGWYFPDKIYGIPNGKKSKRENKNARYLGRIQNRNFCGSVDRGVGGRRGVVAFGDWSYVSGVEKINEDECKHEYVCKHCGKKRD